MVARSLSRRRPQGNAARRAVHLAAAERAGVLNCATNTVLELADAVRMAGNAVPGAGRQVVRDLGEAVLVETLGERILVEGIGEDSTLKLASAAASALP